MIYDKRLAMLGVLFLFISISYFNLDGLRVSLLEISFEPGYKSQSASVGRGKCVSLRCSLCKCAVLYSAKVLGVQFLTDVLPSQRMNPYQRRKLKNMLRKSHTLMYLILCLYEH